MTEGEDAIFCEGECQVWLYRKCVGLAKCAFTLIGNFKEPFLCPHYSSNHYKKEINELKELVKSLSNSLSSLLNQINPTGSTSSADSVSNLVNNQPLANQLSHSTKSASHQSTILLANKSPSSLPDNSVDQKFNLVIYGVKENTTGTQRRA